MWKALEEAFASEAPIDVGVRIQVTDVLEPVAAREAYVAARAEPGTAALIVADESSALGDLDYAARIREELTRYEELGDGDPFPTLPDERGPEEALARVAKLVDGDPMAFLHRIDVWSLGGEGDEGDELDPESLAPDDVKEAYDAELAARAERLSRARGAGALMLTPGPLRTYDEATALRELCTTSARVMRVAGCSQAKAMIYAGFGGWSSCPAPAKQARVWEHWYRTIRGEPVVLGRDTLGAIIGAPVRERAALVRLAREAVAYDRDALVEGYLPLLSMLVRTTSVSFWWD